MQEWSFGFVSLEKQTAVVCRSGSDRLTCNQEPPEETHQRRNGSLILPFIKRDRNGSLDPWHILTLLTLLQIDYSSFSQEPSTFTPQTSISVEMLFVSHVDLLSFQIWSCSVREISTERKIEVFWAATTRAVSSTAKWRQSSWNLSGMFTAQFHWSGNWIMVK